MDKKIFLCLAYAVSLIQLGSGNWISDHCNNIPNRPGWIQEVQQGFKTAHFANPTIPTPQGMSLNHVLSWSAIKAIMSDLLQGLNQANGVNGWQSYNRKISLNSFIQRLFALDYEAYVRTDSSINIFYRQSQGHVGE